MAGCRKSTGWQWSGNRVVRNGNEAVSRKIAGKKHIEGRIEVPYGSAE